VKPKMEEVLNEAFFNFWRRIRFFSCFSPSVWRFGWKIPVKGYGLGMWPAHRGGSGLGDLGLDNGSNSSSKLRPSP